MIKNNPLVLSVLVLGTLLLSACAQPSPKSAPPAPSAPVTKSQASPAPTANEPAEQIKEVGNTLCPISNSKVGSMVKGAHVDYKGYRVGLCCNDCKAKFLAAPDENLKKAQDKK